MKENVLSLAAEDGGAFPPGSLLEERIPSEEDVAKAAPFDIQNQGIYAAFHWGFGTWNWRLSPQHMAVQVGKGMIITDRRTHPDMAIMGNLSGGTISARRCGKRTVIQTWI